MKHGWQNIKIAILAILTAVFVVITVMQAIPKERVDLQAKEAFTISSSLINVDTDQYSSQLTGVIYNSTQKTIHISSLKFFVSDGTNTKEIVLNGFVLPAHGEKNILHVEESAQSWKRIDEIVAIVDGESQEVQNSFGNSSVSGLFWMTLILSVGAACFLAQSCMVRYYMAQEDSIKKEQK